MLSIRNKLYVGFGLILLFMFVQLAVVYGFLHQSRTLVDTTITSEFNNSVEVARLGTEAHKLRRFEKEYLIHIRSPGKRAGYYAEWKGAHKNIQSMLTGIAENREQRWSPADIAAAIEWQKALNAYEVGFLRVVAAADSGRIASALQGNEAVRDAKDAFRLLLDGTAAAIDRKYQRAVASAQAINGKFTTVNLVLVIVALAGAALAVTMLIVVPAAIARPIEVLTRAAHDMSTGNLGTSISITGSPEFHELGATLERMRIAQQMMLDRLQAK